MLKKLLIALICILPAVVKGQSTTVLPTGTTAYTPQFRYTSTAADTLKQVWVASGSKYNRWYTATEINRLLYGNNNYFQSKLDSIKSANNVWTGTNSGPGWTIQPNGTVIFGNMNANLLSVSTDGITLRSGDSTRRIFFDHLQGYGGRVWVSTMAYSNAKALAYVNDLNGFADTTAVANKYDTKTFSPLVPFADTTQITPPAGEAMATWASVVKSGSKYYMFYSRQNGTAYTIDRKESNDGKTGWTNNVTVLTGSAGKFDEYKMWLPRVWIEGGTWYLFYTGQSTSLAVTIGYATSSNGTSWTKQNSGNPVLSPTAGTWDAASTELAGIIKVGNTYYMSYNILGTGTERSTGIATSTNLTTWTKPANPTWTGGRFCGDFFKIGQYYYYVTPHYMPPPYTELELWQDTSPTFANKRLLNVVLNTAGTGYASAQIDVPYVLTDDITRSTFNASNGDIYLYAGVTDYSQVSGSNKWAEALYTATTNKIGLVNSPIPSQGNGYGLFRKVKTADITVGGSSLIMPAINLWYNSAGTVNGGMTMASTGIVNFNSTANGFGFGTAGTIYNVNYVHPSSINNANMVFGGAGSVGMTFTNNNADAAAAVSLGKINASATGNIVNFVNNAGIAGWISRTGVINSQALTASQLVGTDASKNLVSIDPNTYYLSTNPNGYQTQAQNDARYPQLSGSYANPSWITSLAQTKITYGGTTAQYIRGDGTFATFPTVVSAFTNDAGYQTQTQTDARYLQLTGGALSGALTSSASIQGTLLTTTNTSGNLQNPNNTSIAASSSSQHQFLGSTNSNYRTVFGGSTSGTLTNGANYAQVYIKSPGTITTSGTNAYVVGLYASAPTVSGTPTNLLAAYFDGLVQANTPTAGDNSTNVATTAFVQGQANIRAVASIKTAAYTTTQTDNIIPVNTTSGSFNVTLLSSAVVGTTYTIENITGTANSATLVGTINGATNYTLNFTKYVTIYKTATGTNTWKIIGNN